MVSNSKVTNSGNGGKSVASSLIFTGGATQTVVGAKPTVVGADSSQQSYNPLVKIFWFSIFCALLLKPIYNIS